MLRLFGNLRIDIRYALRTCQFNPGFTAAAVIAIAVGVGINTGIFSVLNGFVLRDMPAPSSHELVTIHQIAENGSQRVVHGSRSMFSTSEYEAYRDGARALTGLLAYHLVSSVTLGGAAPQELVGSVVSCNYFDVLQQQPALGRGFAADTCENQQGAPEVVLGHELWASAFAADPAIVGRTVVLNRYAFTVAGVAPAGFDGVDMLKASFFAPLSVQALLDPQRDLRGDNQDVYRDDHASWLTLVGRREPSTELDQLRAELAVIAAQLDRLDPGRRTALVIERATPFSLPELRPAVLGASGVLMAAFALVLLIACANVANLFLARSATRVREIALRFSLGATRGRLIQQLLTESVLIAIVGGALGSLLALWSFQGLVAFVLSSLPAEVPAIRVDPRPDFTVLSFAVLLTLGTGIVFGLLPALHASSPNQYTALKHDTAGAPGGRWNWSRGALVGTQVAVCLVLTICASLLLRALYEAQTVEPGFDYRGVTVATFDLEAAGYDAAKAGAFNQALMERLTALPGVTAVAQTAKTPLSPGSREFELHRPGESDQYRFDFNAVSPTYFSLLGIPIVRGRAFTSADFGDAATAMIVTQATARRFWPGEEPLGKTLVLDIGPGQSVTFEVVGVTADASVSSLGEIDDDYAYLPTRPSSQSGLEILVKGSAEQATTALGVREVLRELDPMLVVRVARLEDNLDFWRTFSSLAATLAGALGALALVLAGIGVYGQVLYAVNLRLREIGIRLALGATGRGVLALVLRQNVRPVAVGAAVGIVLCFLIARLLSSLLFGVSTLDPLAIGGATLFVLGVAFIASVLPARRAMRVDPMTTLRYE